MAERVEIINVNYKCPAGSEVSGDFQIGKIGIVPLRCEQYPNSCRVTIRRIRDPREGVKAFQVAGFCTQKNDWLSQRIEVDAVASLTIPSE